MNTYACPPLSEALSHLRSSSYDYPKIVQRPCQADDGSARLSVGGTDQVSSKTMIYDPATSKLVGVHLTEDGFGTECGRFEARRTSYGDTPSSCLYRDPLPDECCGNCQPPDAGDDAGRGDAATGPQYITPFDYQFECILTASSAQ